MAESPHLLSLGALCRENLDGFIWSTGADAPTLLMPRELQHDRRQAVKMRVEHNVPVIQAEFGQADLLDAESEVIRFILRFFGSVNK
eukprot:8443620-Alexandrium_andersonii.AAC.1